MTLLGLFTLAQQPPEVLGQEIPESSLAEVFAAAMRVLLEYKKHEDDNELEEDDEEDSEEMV